MTDDPTHLSRPAILPFMDPKLARAPGLHPLDDAEWLQRDSAFTGQMAMRDDLVAQASDVVIAPMVSRQDAAVELLSSVLVRLQDDPGYVVAKRNVTRPDGVTVPLEHSDPLRSVARLVQEDFLILAQEDQDYRLCGGVLCFPAGWSLRAATGNGLDRIHGGVPFYQAQLAKRVSRVFGVLRAETSLWRANWLLYLKPDLHQPIRQNRASAAWDNTPIYLRVERQTLKRLPESGAVVFGIKTDISRLDALRSDEVWALSAAVDSLSTQELAYKGGAPVRNAVRRLAEAMPSDP